MNKQDDPGLFGCVMRNAHGHFKRLGQALRRSGGYPTQEAEKWRTLLAFTECVEFKKALKCIIIDKNP
jgi:hypothetical protein